MSILDLASLINQIKNKCEQILKQCIEIGKVISNKNNGIVKDIKEKGTKDSLEIILEKIQKYLLKQSEDAKMFLDEYKLFFVVTERGFRPNKNCTFLYPLWVGDVYDEKGINSLNYFFNELEKQYKSIFVKQLALDYVNF